MLPFLAAAPLALLPGVTDVLSGPRKALFSALGADESGSGSSLLQALLGVDPSSDAGQYGGLAAEMIGDPLNALALGGLGAASLGAQSGRAAKVAGLEGELASANKMVNLAREAEATVPLTGVGPGNLPLGSQAKLKPEVVLTGARKPVAQQPLTNDMTPEILSGLEGNRYRDNVSKQLARDTGTPGVTRGVDTADVEEELLRRLGVNRTENAATRTTEWAGLGREPVMGWDMMGKPDKSALLEQLLGSPRLQQLMPGMASPSQMPGIAPGVLSSIEASLASAKTPQEASALLNALLAGGYAFGGGTAGIRAAQV